VIRRLLSQVDGVSVVALEIGFDQGDAVAALVRGAGFSSVERLRDLAGHERVVVGRR
jgi:release factor glutamine methyltransferase